MANLRDVMQRNPMVGWGIAAVLLLAAAAYLFARMRTGETIELAETITIRCAETGDTWTMTRGAMEKELYLRPLPLDPNHGLINPKTGKPTGFPIDAWQETVMRVTEERLEVGEKPRAPAPGSPPAATAPPAPQPAGG